MLGLNISQADWWTASRQETGNIPLPIGLEGYKGRLSSMSGPFGSQADLQKPGLHSWIGLRYPMKKRMRVRLGALFYELAVMPGLDPQAMGIAADMVRSLLKSVCPSYRHSMA